MYTSLESATDKLRRHGHEIHLPRSLLPFGLYCWYGRSLTREVSTLTDFHNHNKKAHVPKAPSASSVAAHRHVANKCGHKVTEMKHKRRALHRRDLSIDTNSDETLYNIHAQAPKYDFIKNWTNILTPEASNGPYFYPKSQTLRQDIREGQPGVPLSLEIGVVDVDTCEPVEDVLIDIWVSEMTVLSCSLVGLGS